MKPTTLTALAASALALSTMLALAEKGAELKPVLAKPGKLLAEDGFTTASLGKNWAANKGDWQVRDGTVVGKEKKSDEHPAVLLFAQPIRDAVMRVSFKLDGANNFNISLNHAKGHLFRVAVAADGLTLTKDKDKKDEASKPVQLGKASGKFEPGKWHTILIETQGAKVSVQADNGAKLEASHTTLDVEKTGYRFVMRGESLLLADLKVWQADSDSAKPAAATTEAPVAKKKKKQ